MNSATITIVCGLILAASLVASYINYKKRGEDKTQTSKQSVSEIIQETSEYFGFKNQSNNEISKAFDLAPLQMASSLTNQTAQPKVKRKKSKKG